MFADLHKFEDEDFFEENRLLNQIRLQNRHNLINVVFGMNVQVNRLGQIQREDAHDGLCIDDISSGHQIEIIIELGNVVYKGLHLVNGIQRNLNSFQKMTPFILFGLE